MLSCLVRGRRSDVLTGFTDGLADWKIDMTKQPEALRVARMLEMRETYGVDAILDIDAMDELRRLHEVNAELLAALAKILWKRPLSGRVSKLQEEIEVIAQSAIHKATGETE